MPDEHGKVTPDSELETWGLKSTSITDSSNMELKKKKKLTYLNLSSLIKNNDYCTIHLSRS